MFKTHSVTWAFFIAIFSIFLVTGLFRFTRLGNVPQGLTQDEAYYLYDAYSISQTSKDLHGVSLPLMFRSTGEYKLNLTYLIAGAISWTGLNTTSARLPSAIAGYLTLFVFYFIIRQLTSKSVVALISVTILALSPWHFGISRLFYESNVGLLFLSLSFLAGLTILKDKKSPVILWVILGLGAALAAYFYGSFRYLGVGLVLLVIVIDYLKSQRFIRHHILTLLLYVLVILPIGSQMFSKAGLMRLSQESKLHEFGYELTINEARSNCYLTSGKNLIFSKICYFFWNKPVLFIEQAGNTAIKLLSPEYLFFKSYDAYIVPSDYGAYLPYLIPFYLLGIYAFFKLLYLLDPRALFMAGSLLGSISIVSLLGSVVYHRNTLGLLIIMVLISLGLNTFLELFSSPKFRKYLVFPLLLTILGLGIFQSSKYLIYYFTTFAIKDPLLFKYDAPDIYRYLSTKRDYTIYDNIFFAPVFAGIYWQLDPADFQINAKWASPDQWGFSNADHWNNLHFQGTNMEKLLCLKNRQPSIPIKTLLVDDPTGHYFKYASFVSHDFSGSLDLHAIYDIDVIYEIAKTQYPGDLCK
ncbi:MAG: glycosyltransferase family 39 protein [Microgenomates group bacterium]